MFVSIMNSTLKYENKYRLCTVSNSRSVFLHGLRIFRDIHAHCSEEALDLMPRGVGIRKREWTRQLLDAVAKCPEMTPAEARKNLISERF